MTLHTINTGFFKLDVTVPLNKKGGSKAFLTELGLIVDKEGTALGMIKEYMGNPYKGKTEMHIYTGFGRMFQSGVYNPKRRELIPDGKFVNKSSNTPRTKGGSGDGINLEEVVIVGTPHSDPSWPPVIDNPGIPVYPGNGGGAGGGIGQPTVPNTKIDLNLLDRIKYPVLGKIVDGLYQKAKTDKKLMDALKKFTNLTEDKILSNLLSGQGPKLTVANDLPPNVVGRYSLGTNEIKININDANDLNKFELDPKVATSLDFFFTSLILHEFVHFGNDLSGIEILTIGEFDAGAQFENAYYRGDVKYDLKTREIYLKKMPQ